MVDFGNAVDDTTNARIVTMPDYDRLSAYVEWYNEERLHWSLDIDNYQTPRKAFFDKCAPYTIRKTNSRWNGGHR